MRDGNGSEVSQTVSRSALEVHQAKMARWDERARRLLEPRVRAACRPAKVRSLEERFTAKVDRRGPSECWPWMGSRRRNTYGMSWMNGKIEGAHRVAWMLANGQPVPAGMVVMHRCDNPPCVNPAHLALGTQRDNIRDMHAKGRADVLRGARHPRAKLTAKDADEIKNLAARRVRLSTLAEEYGVSRETISAIVRGKHHTQQAAAVLDASTPAAGRESA